MAMSLFQTLIGILVAASAMLLMNVIFPKEDFVPTKVISVKEESFFNREAEKGAIEIQTKNGIVKGFKELTLRGSRPIYSFRGIPFAEPPINELRFKDPVAVKPWSGTRGGASASACTQYDYVASLTGKLHVRGQEDCLYLNVYTPVSQSSNLPVMVYIHGGGFAIGDASVYGGTPEYLLNKDIVLVSIQYRLGTLGFLSTEDSVLPGNLGMKDQTLALQWVQENIHNFGGDPKRVTIFGESAGGASVHLHLLSPYSEGLFHQAILQSGNALAPFAVRSDHKAIAAEVKQMLNCPETEDTDDSNAFLKCLQMASFEEITLTALKLTKFALFPFYMIPRVDGDYLPEHPVLLLKEGLFHKVNIMSGFTSHEGAFITMMLLMSEQLQKAFVENFEEVGPVICGVENEDAALHLTKTIFYHYMDDIKASEKYAEEITEISSEIYFRRGFDDSIMLHAKDSSSSETKVFAYEFAHPSKRSPGSIFNTTLGHHWVAHADELQYLFGPGDGLHVISDPTEIFVSDIMIDLWTSFARTGNPTPDMSLGFKWDPVTEDSYRRLMIRPSPIMRHDDLVEKRKFWSSLPITINKLLYPEQFAQEGASGA